MNKVKIYHLNNAGKWGYVVTVSSDFYKKLWLRFDFPAQWKAE